MKKKELAKKISFSSRLMKASKIDSQKDLNIFAFDNHIKNQISLHRKLKNRI